MRYVLYLSIMKKIENKTIVIGVVILLGLVAIYGVSAYALPKVLVTMTKAAPATKVSLNNSYVLGQVVLAKADGKDKNIVNVFVLDSSSKGVSGKEVGLSGEGVMIKPATVMSDIEGKATFEVTSDKEQQVELTAAVEGMPMASKLKVTFRN